MSEIGSLYTNRHEPNVQLKILGLQLLREKGLIL